PHHLDQNCELQFAASRNLELIGRSGFFDANGDVAEHFSIETFFDLTGSYELTLSARERRIVDAEDHRDCWLIDSYYRQRLRIVRRGNRLANVDVLDTRERDDLAYARTLCQFALQAFENVKLFHFRFLDGAFV